MPRPRRPPWRCPGSGRRNNVLKLLSVDILQSKIYGRSLAKSWEEKLISSSVLQNNNAPH